ncbi:MAG: ribonuclease J [Anaerorhabdus sp.]
MNQVKIFALGGLDEDGKNMYCVDVNGSIFVIEAGLKYPDNEGLGIEMIIPDTNYLIENAQRVKAIFITHGHEDVMAALPNLLKQIKVPVYTAPLTAEILESNLKKENITGYKINRIKRNDEFVVENHSIITFGVTQSIADGFGVAIGTPSGYVVYTSEFIIDYDTQTPSFYTEIDQFTEIGKKGVLALLAESVGATRVGHTAPHHRITSLIEQDFEDATDRIVITMYHQNLYRVIEVVELANKYHKKIVFMDAELRKLMKTVSDLGYYNMPPGMEISKERYNQDMRDVVVIVSGDGSTIFKKIHKIATKADDFLEFRPSDTIIIASPAVPGTEREATKMENDLYKEGATIHSVVSKEMFSMHASIEDLKMMLYLFKPKYYIPVKGQYRQLIANANIALKMGYSHKEILVLDNGQIANFVDGTLKDNSDIIKLEEVLVDGKANLDTSGMVLRDRDTLSTEGTIIVGIVVDFKTKEVIGGPDVQSRGVIYLKDSEHVIKMAGEILEETIKNAVKEKRYENASCRLEARDKIIKYIIKETGKRPMVLPAIIEIRT